MFIHLKQLWKRCRRIRGFSHNYTILPRRRTNRGNIFKKSTCCGFYCVSNSFYSFVFIAVIMTIFVMSFNGVTVLDVLDVLKPPVVLRISSLDDLDDVNFPKADGKKYHRMKYAEENQTSILKLVNSDNAVFWKVHGFSKYIEQFDDDPDVLGMFGKLTSGKNLNKDGSGFWVYRFDPQVYNDGKIVNSPTGLGSASIYAFGITDHISITLEQVEVAVAIRAYVDGEATISIKYESSLFKHVHTDQLEKKDFKNKGFCYKILDIPFEKRISMINIRPKSLNFRRHGIVIVDQVIIIVAQRGVTENLMYTLVPKNWC